MSATLVTGYTGLLEDVHIVQICQILGIPLNDQAAELLYGTFFTPTTSYTYSTARTALFTQILSFESNAQVESKVLNLLSTWEKLPLAGTVTLDTGTYPVSAAQREIRSRLQMIYPMVILPPSIDAPMGR